MRLDDQRESSNIESQRGRGGFDGFGLPMMIGGRGLGIGGIIAVAVIGLLLGVNPLALLGGGDMVGQTPQQATPGAAGPAAIENETDRFVARVLGSTEDMWNSIFAENGQDYPEPTLVFYDGTGQSGCGVAQAAVGPFYCPADNRIFLDTSFFEELSRRFGAPGDFAQAYVIAHEVGHHVQTVTGISDQVRRAQSRASERAANAIQVRMELQADCFAGIWANRNQQRLEPGDIQEALTAAEAIGDDTLQRQAQGRVVPDSFTHGTSAQRMRWFRIGYEQGNVAACDTFAADNL